MKLALACSLLGVAHFVLPIRRLDGSPDAE